jgi:hypothetical protein
MRRGLKGPLKTEDEGRDLGTKLKLAYPTRAFA